MFETVEMLVSGLRGMALQRNLLSHLLETAEYTKSFVSQRKNDEEKLRLRLEQAEASSSTAREENKVLREENEVLREEVAEAKSREDLWKFAWQKEELEGEFAAEREELEAEYQKQVDEMYLFGYRCCMKKHGIKRDVPSIPPGELEKLRSKPAQ
ncbi:uncharacterized protein LOC117928257 [Vitis riparia]|uniref:uncharacterized protein LOC117928257 n=1 Tax=Vitis riparia TaxID=96939 RepID=UPI00155B131B|nr:uncharacterized protein LOC117928257 [Vitis riparia]